MTNRLIRCFKSGFEVNNFITVGREVMMMLVEKKELEEGVRGRGLLRWVVL